MGLGGDLRDKASDVSNLIDDGIEISRSLTAELSPPGLLQAEPDIRVVGEASDGGAAVDLARQVKPDIVLMDISMPGMDGIEATKIIHKEMPRVSIIGLSMFQEGEQADAILRAGAVRYLTKTGPSGEMAKPWIG